MQDNHYILVNVSNHVNKMCINSYLVFNYRRYRQDTYMYNYSSVRINIYESNFFHLSVIGCKMSFSCNQKTESEWFLRNHFP